MSDVDKIDYQPLAAVSHATGHELKLYMLPALGILIGSGTVAILAGIFISVGLGALLAVLLVFCYLIGGWWFIYGKAGHYRDQLWQQFATVNNWPFDTTPAVVPKLPPSLVEIIDGGTGQKYSPIIHAQLGQLPCDLFSVFVPMGKTSSILTIAHLPLSITGTLPHIFLDNKAAKAGKGAILFLSDDPGHGIDYETLHLEGDFQKYFKLGVEKGQEVDALAIITPDVMQAMIVNNRSEVVEIADKDLYFVLQSLGDKRDVADIQGLINMVVTIGDQIIGNITQQRVSVSAAPSVPASPNLQAI